LVAISDDCQVIALETRKPSPVFSFRSCGPITVAVLETSTAASIHTRGVSRELQAMSFSPGAKILGLMTRNKLQLLDTWSWNELACIRPLEFSGDDDLISHCFSKDEASMLGCQDRGCGYNRRSLPGCQITGVKGGLEYNAIGGVEAKKPASSPLQALPETY
jgi:hypothetical protein